MEQKNIAKQPGLQNQSDAGENGQVLIWILDMANGFG